MKKVKIRAFLCTVLSAAMLVCAAAAILLFDTDVILVIIVCGCISGLLTWRHMKEAKTR